MTDRPVILVLKLAASTVENALYLTPAKCSCVLSAMRLHLPYVWWASTGGTVLLCGREYQPIGSVCAGCSWTPSDFNHLTISASTVGNIPGMKKNSGLNDRWFYHDGNSPWHSKDCANAYLKLINANIDALLGVEE